ncbi:DinB family protein [Limibacter armeniacum]|uniref:DinB family protein n=1 Tax=Limibacter armeniacum TaxID=466084 RepID=UPI002FE664C3
MKFNTQELIKELSTAIISQQQWMEREIQTLSEEELNWKAAPDSWSILECVEHLNRYAEFYLDKFEAKTKCGEETKSDVYQSGWLGNYFANSMLPKEGKVTNRMKTFSDKNPSGSNLTKKVLEVHQRDQERLVEILNDSSHLDFGKNRIPTTLGSWMKLKYGDALRFIINHIVRHYVQLHRIREGVEAAKQAS